MSGNFLGSAGVGDATFRCGDIICETFQVLGPPGELLLGNIRVCVA
jgi:hypothetical protein